jgi:uncharacterized protein
MKVVVDTNVLVASIHSRATIHPIWQAVKTGSISMIVSTEILYEYEEILGQIYSPELAKFIVNIIQQSKNTIRHTNFYFWNLIHIDPDDNKFVDTAFNGGAAYLITEDKHFNVLSKVEFPKIQVISPKKFLKILAGLS